MSTGKHIVFGTETSQPYKNSGAPPHGVFRLRTSLMQDDSIIIVISSEESIANVIEKSRPYG